MSSMKPSRMSMSSAARLPLGTTPNTMSRPNAWKGYVNAALATAGLTQPGSPAMCMRQAVPVKPSYPTAPIISSSTTRANPLKSELQGIPTRSLSQPQITVGGVDVRKLRTASRAGLGPLNCRHQRGALQVVRQT